MAKPRVTVVDSEGNADAEADAQDFAALNEDSGGSLFNTVDELRAGGAAGVVCIVTRHLPVEKKGFCCNISVAEFSLEKMRAMVGPGKYMVQIKGPKGFLPGGGVVDIAEMAQTTPTGAGGLETLLERMERRDEERRKEAADRTTKIWELAMVSVPTLLAGFFNRPQPQSDIPALIAALKPAPGPSITELTSALANMQSLTTPKNSESTVDTVLKVFEAAQGLVGDGGKGDSATKDGSNWVDVIRDLIKAAPEALKPVLEARMAAMQAAQPGVRATVHPAIAFPPSTVPGATIAAVASNPDITAATGYASSAASTPTDSSTMMAMFMPLVKTNLEKVVGWAEKNRDPQIYSDVLVDELPDGFGDYIPITDVISYLNHPEWFSIIVGIEPRLSTHKEWCDECRLAIIEIMKEFELELHPTNNESDTKPKSVETGSVVGEANA